MIKTSVIIQTTNATTMNLLKLFIEEIDGLEIIDIDKDSNSICETISNINSPVLYIMDVSENTEDSLSLLKSLMIKCSNCRALVLSDNPTVDLILRIIKYGARDFIPIPIIKKEFIDLVNNIISQKDLPKKKISKCKIYTVYSNKGGIGKTSLATNIAIELAQTTKENVALLDMNFNTGDITTFLDLHPTFNISYLLENIDKLNEQYLLSTMERYKDSSLYVLADPPFFKQANNIKSDKVEKLLETLKDTFSYIIIDADSSFDDRNVKVLDSSDIVFLVTVANLPALRNTQRCLELFDKLGYDREKVQIVLNRYMENDEIKCEDVEKVLSKKIYWKVPNNYFAIMSSINKALPVGLVSPNSNVAQSYMQLAQYITDNIYKQGIANDYGKILVD